MNGTSYPGSETIKKNTKIKFFVKNKKIEYRQRSCFGFHTVIV